MDAHKLLVMAFLCLPLFSNAQFSGARITALANTGVVTQDVWSLQANQAGITEVKESSFSAGFERRYLNPDLATRSAVVVTSFKNNFFGLSFQSYGFSAYKEQKVGLAFAKKFGTSFSAALNANYWQIKIPQYGSSHALSVEAGFQCTFSKKILIGGHFSNPSNSAYNSNVSANIPVIAELGASYAFSDDVKISSAIFKDLRRPVDLRCGLEYSPNNWIFLRGGISANPFMQFFGLGVDFNHVGIDVASSFHPVLGYSPQIDLRYAF